MTIGLWALFSTSFPNYRRLSGFTAFSTNDEDLYQRILGGIVDYPPIVWSHIDPLGADLVKKLLVVDVSQRLTVAEALRHPWCVRGLNLLKAQGGALGEMATKELEDQAREVSTTSKVADDDSNERNSGDGDRADNDDEECGGFIREDESINGNNGDDGYDDDDDFMPDKKKMKL